MDARLVGKGVLADDGLVGLHVDAGDVREQPRGLEDLLGLHGGLEAKEIPTGAQRHHDLFERGVAGALADAVDGAFHLAGAVHERGQRVGHRLAEVVVAVDGQNRLVDAVDPLPDVRDALRPLRRDGVADRVGDVDRAGAGVDDRRQHVAHVVEVGARGILRRELDVLAVPAGVADGFDGRLHHFGPRLAQLVLEVDVGGRHEGVDAGAPGVPHRFPAAVDVAETHAAQAADDRGALQRAHLAGDLPGRLEVLLRRDGESGFDDVHVQSRQLPGHLQLLHRVHGEPGRLLAVAQRRVEDDHSVHGGYPPSAIPWPARRWRRRAAGLRSRGGPGPRARIRRRRGTGRSRAWSPRP